MGQRLRREGEGAGSSYFLTSLLAPPHGEHTQRGRGGTETPLVEEAAQSYTHATHTHTRPTHTHAHTNKPAHTGQADHREAERCGSRVKKQQSLDRQGSRPSSPPTPFPKVSPEPPHPTLCLAILSWPLASPAAGDEKEKGYLPSRRRPSPAPVPHAGQSARGAQGRLLAGHS